jgi:hypothetical protein
MPIRTSEVIYPEVLRERHAEEASTEQQARQLERLAHWLDSAFKVPGLGLRFGLDALVGLVPGLGDTLTSLVSLHILNAARRLGVSRVTMLRMAGNIAVDYAIGSLPFLGDALDVYWKSNKRNVALLRRHLEGPIQERRRAERGDLWFMIGLVLLLALLLIGCVSLSLLITTAAVKFMLGS